MTALSPVASRSPDRTGVCRAGRSAPSQCEMVTGPGFSSRNQPDQERTTTYRDSSGPNSRPDAHFATIVGDWQESSGESLVNFFSKTVSSISFNHNLIQHKVPVSPCFAISASSFVVTPFFWEGLQISCKRGT